MHSVICAFDDRGRAEQALDALVRSGLPRHDVHIEHRELYRRPANDAWDGLEREIAVDRGVLSSFGHFFTSLLGRDHPSGHADTYARHVERGSYVVVADARDEAEADRLRALLHDLEARDLDLVHRPGQRPLRDIVGMRQEGMRDDTAGMVERSREPYEGWSSTSSNLESERAVASHRLSPTTGPDLRGPDPERAPGLRYPDKDKPNG